MSMWTRRSKWFALALASTENSPSSAAHIPPTGASNGTLPEVWPPRHSLLSSPVKHSACPETRLAPAIRAHPQQFEIA